MNDLGIGKVDGILLDLGVSSYQLDERNRGFSYLGKNELDMRMDRTQDLTAKYVVNNYDEERLANIIYEYGEEKFSRNIAKNICKYRQNKQIETTEELVHIIENSIPKAKQKDGHPAKRTFQAIRIEVNNEIKPLYDTILKSIECLNENGRLCVITFHSLEDRAVKNAYTEAQGKCTCPKDLPYCVCNYKSFGKIINKKPIEATENEKTQKKKFHLVDNEYLNAYESTKNDSELMAQLFGEQQNERVYSIELDEMDMEKPKSKGGKNNDLQH